MTALIAHAIETAATSPEWIGRVQLAPGFAAGVADEVINGMLALLDGRKRTGT